MLIIHIFIFLYPPLPSWEFWQGHFQSLGATQQQEVEVLAPIHQDKTGSSPPISKHKGTFSVHHTSDRICFMFMILFGNNICFKIFLVAFMICYVSILAQISPSGILQQTPFPKCNIKSWETDVFIKVNILLDIQGLLNISFKVLSVLPLTVPSPPQARILRLWTFRYSSRLQDWHRLMEVIHSHQWWLPVGLYTCVCCVCLSYPSFGPAWLRSNTCLGFRFHIKDCRILVPWQIMEITWAKQWERILKSKRLMWRKN